MVEISDVFYDPGTQFHMLRHFESIDDVLKSDLCNAGYTIEQMEEELFLPGSKFYSSFAVSIADIFTALSVYSYTERIAENGNVILECEVPLEIFPNGIGSNAVVSVDSILPEQRLSIYEKQNRSVLLYHLSVSELPATNTFSVLLKKQADKFTLITAFPGQAGLPIPFEGMDTSWYQKCVDFWKCHVFLKLKQ